MSTVKGRGKESLESRAIAAHHSYLEAFTGWERAFHEANQGAGRKEGAAKNERMRQYAAAEAEKERRRVVFRDLCGKLGYIPGCRDVTSQTVGCRDGID